MAKEKIAFGSYIKGKNININMLSDFVKANQLMLQEKNFLIINKK